MKCQASVTDVITKMDRQNKGLPPVCGNVAKFKIDDQCLCKKHAQVVALNKIVAAGQATEIAS